MIVNMFFHIFFSCCIKKHSIESAKAVMDALIAKGVDKTRMSFVGWGQEKAVADNRSKEGRAQNRRVEIVKK